MYRRAMPLIVAMVGLCACAALPDTLSVDFGVSDSPVAGPSANDVENGFFDFSVPSDEINNVPPVANTIVSSLGTGGTVRVTVSGVTQGCFWRDRDVEKTGTLGDLAEEFAACGTDLALTLSDLRAGFYTMTTYHHDQVYTTPAWPADTSVGIDMIVVASGGGTSTVVTDDVVSAGQAEPPTSVTFQFSANGVDDVVVTFKDRVGGNPVLNGFELYARNVVIDDGDAGYSESSGWTLYTDSGSRTVDYNNDFRYCAYGDASAWAQWAFTNLQAGGYDVYASWWDYSNKGTNVVYTEMDSGNGVIATINQQNAASADFLLDDGSNGITFQRIGTVTVSQGGTLRFRATDPTLQVGHNWVADAIAIKPAVPDWEPPPIPNYGVPVPGEVAGRVVVYDGGQTTGVANVSVSDGFSVVKTDAQGEYSLTPSTNAVFINITRPAGYDVLGYWYKAVTNTVDFGLTPSADENEYTFVHVSDTHISTYQSSLDGLRLFVQEVSSLNPKPRFVLNSGDLVNLDKTLSAPPAVGHAYFEHYVGTMNDLGMPYYNVAGDHSDSSYRLETFPLGDIRAGKPLFYEYLGPNFFSFEYGKIHFMCVDFVYHLSDRATNGVQPLHAEWMHRDMTNRTEGTFVVTSAEWDLLKFCPNFDVMASQNDVRLQFIGDAHIVARKARFVPYRVGGALSGCWWNPNTDLCPDGSPRGYAICRVQGETVESFYKGLGQRVAIASHRLGAPWTGSVVLQAHVVAPVGGEVLEYALNGSDWRAMSEVGQPFYRALYEATVDSTLVADGLAELQVRSSVTGETRTQTIVVGNGEALPAEATLSFNVGTGLGQGIDQAPSNSVDVLFNDAVIGVLAPSSQSAYSFSLPAAGLRKANTLSFDFAGADDGMGISAPVLTVRQEAIRDPRDVVLREIRLVQWGAGYGEQVVDWGGFIVGDGGLEEGPFARKQHTFCFVQEDRRTGAVLHVAHNTR